MSLRTQAFIFFGACAVLGTLGAIAVLAGWISGPKLLALPLAISGVGGFWMVHRGYKMGPGSPGA